MKVENDAQQYSAAKSPGARRFKKTVSVAVDHFTLFAIMSDAPKSTRDGVIVYPTPSRNGESSKFAGLTTGARIRIYTVNAGLVNNFEDIDVSYEWNLTNKEGQKVSSGAYFYVITNKAGQEKKGKLAVIR